MEKCRENFRTQGIQKKCSRMSAEAGREEEDENHIEGRLREGV